MSEKTSDTIHTLDARRLLCPMPVIRLQQKIEDLIKTSGNQAKGNRIKVSCTDPGAMYDIPAWSKVHGHKVIDTLEQDNEFLITIEISVI